MEERERGFLTPPEQRPGVSADIAAFQLRRDGAGESGLHVLLVRRGAPPYRGCWALPGGFLLPGESLDDCAAREVRAETGIAPDALIPVGVYSRPDRDPRGRVVTQAYAAVIREDAVIPVGGDDAAEAAWFRLMLTEAGDGHVRLRLSRGDEALEITLARRTGPLGIDRHREEGPTGRLAFDHGEIIADAAALLRFCAGHYEAVFGFLPPRFTLSALQRVVETLTGKPVAAANFRRKIMPYVRELPEVTRGDRHRPARLYTAREHPPASDRQEKESGGST